MKPDLFWHYKHLLKQIFTDFKNRIKKVDIPALALTWEVVGVDISAWQYPVDFAKLEKMVNFAIIRAGYGNDYFDPRMGEYIKGCEEYNIPYALYWFVKAGKNPDLHAQNFHAVWKLKPGKIYPVFDLEDSGGLGKSAFDSWLRKMYDKFMRLSGLPFDKVMTYTSAGFLDRALGQNGWLKLTWLWVAHWTTAPSPIIPKEWSIPGKTYQFWQWSATGYGKLYGVSSRYVDLDRYNGTREQFNAEFGVTEPPPPPPPPGDEDMIAKVIAIPFVNVRSGPGSNYSDVGDLPTNSTFKVKNVLRGLSPACSVWLQIKDGQFADMWACLFDGTNYLAEIVT